MPRRLPLHFFPLLPAEAAEGSPAPCDLQQCAGESRERHGAGLCSEERRKRSALLRRRFVVRVLSFLAAPSTRSPPVSISFKTHLRSTCRCRVEPGAGGSTQDRIVETKLQRARKTMLRRQDVDSMDCFDVILFMSSPNGGVLLLCPCFRRPRTEMSESGEQE